MCLERRKVGIGRRWKVFLWRKLGIGTRLVGMVVVVCLAGGVGVGAGWVRNGSTGRRKACLGRKTLGRKTLRGRALGRKALGRRRAL